MTMAAIRLYVGGLGERVTETDLRSTFSHLGSVQSVDIIRTKGRSFAYIDFLPLSENSLAKLFSTYNGCLWKGGKLKLEKAKQHYIDRLKQQWAEDAKLHIIEEDTKDRVDESIAASSQLRSTLDLAKMQFRCFFPKLRKVKSLPLCGTGKHKYSFQRVQVPPLPRLFCDCPEHCDPVETPKITKVSDSDIQIDKMNDVINMKNSVIDDRLMNKGTSTKEGNILYPREAQDHDLQDGGMNLEEINVMNSVMKKLLDRESVKYQQKDLIKSSHMSVTTLELEENADKMDEETDDDDIKINVASGANVGYDSWETSLVNKMVGSSEQWNSCAGDNKLVGGKRGVKPLTKKRKLVTNESDDRDLVSPVHRKRVRLEIQSKEVDEHLELNGVKELETKQPVTGGMWSQKSSWKEPIVDDRSGSFQLSNITPGDQTNDVGELISFGETSSDKEVETVRNLMKYEHIPRILTSSDKVELESVGKSVCENVEDNKRVTLDTEGVQAALPLKSSAGLDKVARGSSWLQKSSWTQLVSGGNSSSFSISQILPGNVLEKQQLSKPKDGSTAKKLYSSCALVREWKSSENALGGVRGSRFGLRGIGKKKECQSIEGRSIQSNETPKGNESSGSSMAKKPEIQKNQPPRIGISGTCHFMRSADSLKEWQNAKATLTKRRHNNK